jgi:5-(carboxyamino)imidazole ribonucleotide mutase
MPARSRRTRQPLVGIIMGSESDYETLARAEDLLRELDVPYEISVVSAHRTPERMFAYAKEAERRGLRVIIAGAGGAAHLPGMVASLTRLPVLGVPVESRALKGIDSLLSIVQMPAGVPTATFAIGGAGAANAALFAARLLALDDPALANALLEYGQANAERTLAGNARVRARLEGDAKRPAAAPLRRTKRAR